MSVISDIDKMIDELERRKTPAEFIVMGKRFFYRWMVEVSRGSNVSLEPEKKKYRFSHRKIQIVVCESDILEVVPNAKHLLS